MAKLVVVAVLANLAVVCANIPDTIVPEESVLQTPGSALQANAVTPTNNFVAAGALTERTSEPCPAGTEECSDGTCAASCTNTAATAGETRYTMDFVPHPTHLDAPPSISAPPAAYLNRAATLKAGQDAASLSAITHAEVSQGLVDAAQDSKQAERAEEIAAAKAKVEVQFNTAAAKGAIYRKKAQIDDQAILAVKTATLQAEEASKEEKVAEEALKRAKEKKKHAETVVSNKQEIERRAKYAAEFAGQQYEQVKAAATASDNALKEREREAAQEQKFREVARAAVVKEAQKEAAAAAALVHAHKSPKVVTKTVVVTPSAKGNAKIVTTEHTKTSTVTQATAVSCSDCTVLEEKYKKLGGSCSDCQQWAKDNQCKHKTYGDFMSKFCAGSCAAVGGVPCPKEAALIQVDSDMMMPMVSTIAK